MHVVFDNIVFMIQRTGGISVVWQELLQRALVDDSFTKQVLDYPCDNLCRKELQIPADMLTRMPVRTLERYRSPHGILPCQDHSTRMACRSAGSTRLGTTGLPRPVFHSSYFRTVDDPGVLNITTVHDMTYHFFRKGLPKAVHCWEEQRALKRSAGVICVSEHTKKDVLEAYPWLDESRVSVVYNGVSGHFSPMPEVENKGYLLYVGNRAAYKNFRLAVEAAALSEQHLMIVGGQLSDQEKAWVDERLKPSQYTVLNGVPNHELNRLYNEALALLYPSAYEGFGIPVLEAMKAGCPVVAMAASSIPEVAGDAALLLNPTDPHPAATMADYVRQLKNGTISRNELQAKGFANAARFSWDHTYQQTKAFYEDIFDRANK